MTIFEKKIMKLLEDNPLHSIRHDLLHREQLVNFVYKSLINSVESNHACRCIGIYGKWGEGKSSFMNFIKERITIECINKEDDKKTDFELRVRTYDFNPWLANNDETLMWDFFNTISKDVTVVIKEKLAKYSGLVTGSTQLIEAASAAAIGISPSMTAVGMVAKYGAKGVRKAWNIGNQILSTLGNKTLSERKEEISKDFRDSGIHRFIFIDDIDRLDKEEIHTVFRLIREVADFDNVTYLIAMDPDIVAKSLSAYFGEGNICDGRDFIEKIIQVPIQLPLVHQLSLKYLLKEKLESLWSLFRCGDEKELDTLCQDLSRILVTQRQIIRFINQVSFVIPALKGEVNMVELCYLEAIKIIDIQAYLRIAHNQKALFKESDEIQSMIDEDKEQQRVLQVYEKTLDDIVKDISMPTREIVRGFIDNLFTPNSASYQLDLDQKKLCTGIYFATYFAQSVPENIISEHSINAINDQISQNRFDDVILIFNDWYHIYGLREVERVVLSIIRKYMECSQRSKICQILIKIIVRTDVVQNYGYTLIDIPNGFTIFVSKELFTAYIRRRIETDADMGYDYNDMYELLSSIYEDPHLAMPFLLDLHARVDEEFFLKNFEFAKSLVDRFLEMPYSEQLKYSKLKLRPIYKALAHLKEDGLDYYFDKALESADFDFHMFFSTLIEDSEFSQDVDAFVSVFGLDGLVFCKRLMDTKKMSEDEQHKILEIIMRF